MPESRSGAPAGAPPAVSAQPPKAPSVARRARQVNRSTPTRAARSTTITGYVYRTSAVTDAGICSRARK